MFLFAGREPLGRSLAEAVSLRPLGGVVSFLLSLLLTSSGKAVGAIALSEGITKMALYYLLEHAWRGIGWCMKTPGVMKESAQEEPA